MVPVLTDDQYIALNAEISSQKGSISHDQVFQQIETTKRKFTANRDDPILLSKTNPTGRSVRVLHGECPVGVLPHGDLPSLGRVTRRKGHPFELRHPLELRLLDPRGRLLRRFSRSLRAGCGVDALPGVPSGEPKYELMPFPFAFTGSLCWQSAVVSSGSGLVWF